MNEPDESLNQNPPTQEPELPPEPIEKKTTLHMLVMTAGILLSIICAGTGAGWLYGGGGGIAFPLPKVHFWMLHLPAGFLLSAFVLDFIGLFFKKITAGLSLLIFLGAITGFVALISGFLLAQEKLLGLAQVAAHLELATLTTTLSFAWWGILQILGFGWREKLLAFLTFICLLGAIWTGTSLSHPLDLL